ncbi:YaaA family protein [Flindersiella endophytica]
MLILLPPSEGKASTGNGPALDLASLGFPALAATRKRVLSTLVRVSGQRNGAQVLGLTPGQAEDLERNRVLHDAPTLPAWQLYTGVLYDNLGLSTLPVPLEQAAESVLVFSGLWGVLRITDEVPPYRLSMGVRLPRIGPLAGLWRPAITKALGSRSDLVVDLRSSTYASAWNPGEHAAAIRVLTADGKVVSHMAKATRGRVARSLLETGADPASPEDLAKLLAELGYAASLSAGSRRGSPRTIDVTT